jgi:hypothetical protein
MPMKNELNTFAAFPASQTFRTSNVVELPVGLVKSKMLCTSEEEVVQAISDGVVEEIYAWNVPLKDRYKDVFNMM